MSSLQAETSTPSRLTSIDVFRGVAIAAMILVNAQYSHEDSYRQLAHAAWNGWTFADVVFPSFLFIVGVSLTYSTAARLARGEGHGQLLGHALRRSLLLFACGVVVDYLRVPARAFPFFGFQSHLQLSGVLQKIAICYFVAFSIYLLAGRRGVIAGIIGFNLAYLGLLYLYPVPGCGPGSLAMTCNFPDYLDSIVLGGFRWNSTAFDPDGVGAILPAITSVLFGVLAGLILRSEKQLHRQVLRLVGTGVALIAAGELLSIWIPINKQLWTPSFALLMAGIAALGLACCLWLVDGGTYRNWFKPLQTLGLNAVAAYLISRLVTNMLRVHVMGKSLHTDVLEQIASIPNASLLFATIVLAAVYLPIWIMHRQGWYLRL